MKSTPNSFTILISTKNRIHDLGITLSNCYEMIKNHAVHCVVFDDGSTDGTFDFVQKNFPEITLYRNETPKGYLYCRNQMLNHTNTDYAISLDDDAHFITQNPLPKIEQHFKENSNCGLLALRIFWGLNLPDSLQTKEHVKTVQGFVGCAHVWRMAAWKQIPDYPEWFIFYGEEDFASYQLFKKKWEIHYFPEILVHHRVNLQQRKTQVDYGIRLRRSLFSGWSCYLLFLPLKQIPKSMLYSVWMQLKLKVFKADLPALKALLWALLDLLKAMPKIVKNNHRLTTSENNAYKQLEATKLYWKPENEVKRNSLK